MKKCLFHILTICSPLLLQSQLNIQGNARVNIQPGAYIVATGNVVSTASLLGTGMLVMKGTSQQQINFNSQVVPTLRIDNPAGVVMTGGVRIGSQLNFANGRLLTGNHILTLDHVATINGAAAGRFIETNGSGDVRRLVLANINNSLVPLGKGSDYTPVYLTTSATYSSAFIRVRSSTGVHPNKPASVSNYLNRYTTVGRSGITGTVTAYAIYSNSSIVGNEASYLGFFWTGTTWSKLGNSINTTSNQITANITGSGGDVYAMNDFASLTQNLVPAAMEAVNTTLYRETVYPNPATQFTNLSIYSSSQTKAEIVLIDMKGAIVQRNTISFFKGYNQAQIKLQELSAGSYEIRVISEGTTKTFKILKK